MLHPVIDNPHVEQGQQMSDHITVYSDHTPAPAKPAKRGRGFWIAVVVGAGVLLGLVVAVAGVFGASGGNPASQGPTVPVAEPAAAAAVGDVAPKVADIKLTPKVIDRECFGSAGCNVTLRVDMQLTAGAPAPSSSWLVVYEIRGVEDGPLIGNLTLTGSSYTGDEEDVQTTSSKSKITVKAVSVEKA